VTDDELTLRYIAELLEEHRQRCRRDGLVLPVGLASALALARGRQRPPRFDPDGDPGEALLVTYEQAALVLAVSKRTVERLVARGELPTVDVGGCRRIARDDLVAYVQTRPRSVAVALVEVA
jgi:excisionase family DNA binding protein